MSIPSHGHSQPNSTTTQPHTLRLPCPHGLLQVILSTIFIQIYLKIWIGVVTRFQFAYYPRGDRQHVERIARSKSQNQEEHVDPNVRWRVADDSNIGREARRFDELLSKNEVNGCNYLQRCQLQGSFLLVVANICQFLCHDQIWIEIVCQMWGTGHGAQLITIISTVAGGSTQWWIESRTLSRSC